MPAYDYADYWRSVADAHAAGDPLGAVCWDGAPPWFNRFFADAQRRALERAMLATFGTTRRAGRALDVGCGTGRWTRWLGRWWDGPVGCDLSAAMLAGGAAGAGGRVRADVTALPFGDATFDMALSVTVLQHLPPAAQERAVAEIARAVKPGGVAVLLEMTNRIAPGPHNFPRPLGSWRGLLDGAGLRVERAEGEGYAPLLRLGVAAGRRLPLSRATASGGDGVKRADGARATAASIGALPAPARLAARGIVALSHPIERVAERLVPARMALHACIVARRG